MADPRAGHNVHELVKLLKKALQAMLDPPELADFVELDGDYLKRFRDYISTCLNPSFVVRNVKHP